MNETKTKKNFTEFAQVLWAERCNLMAAKYAVITFKLKNKNSKGMRFSLNQARLRKHRMIKQYN